MEPVEPSDTSGVAHDDVGNAGALEGSMPERILLYLAMISIGLLCLIVTISVISRAVYRPLIPDDVLVVRELMVAAICFPLAAVTAARSHIAVTVFTEWVPMRGRALLSVVASLFGLVFTLSLMFAAFRLFSGALASGEYYDGDIYIPTWIGYATFVLAMGIFAARLVVTCYHDIRVLRTPENRDG